MAKLKMTKASKKDGKGSPLRAAARVAGRRKARATSIVVDFPTEPDPLSTDLRDFSMLIHGEKKIGKTSMLAQEEKAFFLEFDPRQQGVSIMQRHIPDWRHFMAYVEGLEELVQKDKCPYRTIIIDGLDLMYAQCFKWACKELVIEHPHDENDYGKSWGFIKENFREGFLRIRNLPGVAVRLICHSRWQEIETRKGKKKEKKGKEGGNPTKLVPTLTGQAEEAIVGDVDIWAAYVYDGKSHVLVVKGDERTGAGHRVDHAFRTPDGEMVEEIYLGQSAQSAYQAVVDAFENRQTYINMEEFRESKPASKPKGTKVRVRRRG